MTIDPAASRLAASGVAYASQIAGAARRHGLDPSLLAAVAAQETGGPDSNAGRNVVGDGGHGHGLFQIDDRSHPFASTAAAMDPSRNADYAAGMISGLLSRYGSVREALSAYNTGSPTATGTKTRWADGTQLGYADSVLRHQARLGGASGAAAAAASLEAPESPAPVAPAPSLFALAGSLPPPSVPPSGGHRHAYHREATDYASLFSNTDESDS